MKPIEHSFFKSDQPTSLRYLGGKYIRYCIHRNLSHYSIYEYQKIIKPFITWCEEREIYLACEVDHKVIGGYHRYIVRKKLADHSQLNILNKIRFFFSWMTQMHYLVYNPTKQIPMPRQEPHFIKEVLTIREIELLLSQPNLDILTGLRDRTMMELFYLTGIRRRELLDLNVQDIDFDSGTLWVKGKNRKFRLVPLGNRAAHWLHRYMTEAREKWVLEKTGEAVFISAKGTRLSLEHIGNQMRSYFKMAGIRKKGCCHLFRHSMATLMLKNGADLRAIQEILGHNSLKTTQVYTHLNIDHLIKVHQKTHPANLKKKNG